jgi:hypothetical protein
VVETDRKGTEKRVSRLVPSQVLEDDVSTFSAEKEEEEEEEAEEEEKAARVSREGAWQRSDVTTLKATSP